MLDEIYVAWKLNFSEKVPHLNPGLLHPPLNPGLLHHKAVSYIDILRHSWWGWGRRRSELELRSKYKYLHLHWRRTLSLTIFIELIKWWTNQSLITHFTSHQTGFCNWSIIDWLGVKLLLFYDWPLVMSQAALWPWTDNFLPVHFQEAGDDTIRKEQWWTTHKQSLASIIGIVLRSQQCTGLCVRCLHWRSKSL